MKLVLAPGTWCSGITSGSHAEGPGFNPQCVQLARCLTLRCADYSRPKTRAPATPDDSGLPSEIGCKLYPNRLQGMQPNLMHRIHIGCMCVLNSFANCVKSVALLQQAATLCVCKCAAQCMKLGSIVYENPLHWFYRLHTCKFASWEPLRTRLAADALVNECSFAKNAPDSHQTAPEQHQTHL